MRTGRLAFVEVDHVRLIHHVALCKLLGLDEESA
jgi:hypothetical protein